jgi:uncharacterized iron-regulated membrane protein
MRRLHRWVGLVSVLFLGIIAVTGIILHLEESGERSAGPDRQAQAGPPGNPAPAKAQQPDIGLPTDELVRWMNTTLKAARKASPDVAITSVQLRMSEGQPQGLVILATPEAKQLVFNARTGEMMETWSSPVPTHNHDSAPRPEAGPQRPHEQPKGQAPPSQGMNAHRLIEGLHKGDLFGQTGIWISIICGLALCLLCLSGVIMYFGLWRQRLRNGQRALFWP